MAHPSSAPPPSFRRSKLVVLSPQATVREAACAMKDNHIGAVLVVEEHRLAGIVTDRDLALAITRDDFDARATRLGDVMTTVVGACAADAGVADVLVTMKQYACRRVPLVEGGRPVGLVTIDDLCLERTASLDDVCDVVRAQLGMPARLKPAGATHPVKPGELEGAEPPSERGRAARAEHGYRALARCVEQRTGLRPRERVEGALDLVLARLCRRLRPEDARELAAGLPAHVRARLEPELDVVDEDITVDSIAEELQGQHGLLPDATADIVLSICDAIASGVSAEGAPPLLARLPGYLNDLFPRGREG